MGNKIVDTRRPVIINANGDKKNLNGYFHMWIKEIAEDKNETAVAIVELEDGTIEPFYTYQIQFKLPYSIAKVYDADEVES